MRITREKVEQLMQFQWDKGFEAGKLAGIQQQALEEQQKGTARAACVDHIESTLDVIEGKKSAAG